MSAIPPGWRVGNIRRFATLKTGHTPSRSIVEYWTPPEIPWFTLADVGQLREETRVYVGDTNSSISELGLRNSAAELLPAGTVLLSRTASVGFSGILSRPMATSQDFWNWICGPELLPEYLNYQFKTMRREFAALSMGSTHRTIYQRDAAGLNIVVPPVKSQRAIADFLDRETAQIDALIAKQEQLIATLRERRASVIASRVLRGDNPLSPPADRPYAAIGSAFSVVLGKMLDAGRDVQADDLLLPYIRAANIQDAGLDLRDVNTMPYSPREAATLDVRRGDLLVVEGGAVGTCVAIAEDMPGWSFQKTVNRVRPLGDWSTRWLGYLLQSYRDSGVISVICSGSTIPHLTAEKLRAIRVPVTSPAEQRLVAEFLDEEMNRTDTLISNAERFIHLSKERRAALISAAVTGQIDVRQRVS